MGVIKNNSDPQWGVKTGVGIQGGFQYGWEESKRQWVPAGKSQERIRNQITILKYKCKTGRTIHPEYNQRLGVSDKNVSGAQQNAEQSTQSSAGQNAGPSAENKEGSAFFHHNAQPDESGWYRSGPNPSAEQKSAYNSRYSYGQQAGEQGSYENQQADPKSSESYKWNYEDYNQQAPKQPTNKNKKE